MKIVIALAVNLAFWLGFLMRDIGPTPVPPIRLVLFVVVIDLIVLAVIAVQRLVEGKHE